MNATAQERKVKALEYLKQLGIYTPFVEGFEKQNQVYCFVDYIGFRIDDVPEIAAKIHEIEEEYECTVYAVTHEFTYFGECYDFLIVSKYSEDWSETLHSIGDAHRAFVYVWNVSDDKCSELGFIGLKSFGGGIKRIGVEVSS